MAETTGISWCDSTFNPWIGCTKVSTGATGGGGCDNCYAEALMDHRMHRVKWGPKGERSRTSKGNWAQPLRWEREHEAFFAERGRRRRVFCASLADVFDNAVPDAWREDLFDLIRVTPHLDWLLLTKRPGNIIPMVRRHGAIAGNGTRYLPDNAWLGASVVNQLEAEREIPKLLATIGQLGARTTFLSCEPLLDDVEVFSQQTGELLHTSGDDYQPGWINWVICGGESGANARPMHPDWARSLRDQCAAAGVPFFFKQWGKWLGAKQDGAFDHQPLELNASDTPVRVGKVAAGDWLDGRQHHEWPRSAT